MRKPRVEKVINERTKMQMDKGRRKYDLKLVNATDGSAADHGVPGIVVIDGVVVQEVLTQRQYLVRKRELKKKGYTTSNVMRPQEYYFSNLFTYLTEDDRITEQGADSKKRKHALAFNPEPKKRLTNEEKKQNEAASRKKYDNTLVNATTGKKSSHAVKGVVVIQGEEGEEFVEEVLTRRQYLSRKHEMMSKGFQPPNFLQSQEYYQNGNFRRLTDADLKPISAIPMVETIENNEPVGKIIQLPPEWIYSPAENSHSHTVHLHPEQNATNISNRESLVCFDRVLPHSSIQNQPYMLFSQSKRWNHGTDDSVESVSVPSFIDQSNPSETVETLRDCLDKLVSRYHQLPLAERLRSGGKPELFALVFDKVHQENSLGNNAYNVQEVFSASNFKSRIESVLDIDYCINQIMAEEVHAFLAFLLCINPALPFSWRNCDTEFIKRTGMDAPEKYVLSARLENVLEFYLACAHTEKQPSAMIIEDSPAQIIRGSMFQPVEEEADASLDADAELFLKVFGKSHG